MRVWINGVESPLEEAVLRPDDLGLQRGYAAFEFLRSEHGRLFHLEDHLRRLENSARLIGIPLPVSREDLTGLCHGLSARSGLSAPAIRILLTGGYASVAASERTPNLIVIAESIVEFPAALYELGASVLCVDFQRECPVAKTNNYLNTFRIESRLQESGADDAIYYSGDLVSEAPRSNVFAVLRGVIATPDENVLPGITRELVIQLAEQSGLKLEVRPLTMRELRAAEEVFLTSTTRRILPVTRIDGAAVGSGRVGSTTTLLMQSFRTYIDNGNWS